MFSNTDLWAALWNSSCMACWADGTVTLKTRIKLLQFLKVKEEGRKLLKGLLRGLFCWSNQTRTAELLKCHSVGCAQGINNASFWPSSPGCRKQHTWLSLPGSQVPKHSHEQMPPASYHWVPKRLWEGEFLGTCWSKWPLLSCFLPGLGSGRSSGAQCCQWSGRESWHRDKLRVVITCFCVAWPGDAVSQSEAFGLFWKTGWWHVGCYWNLG